MRNKTQDKTPDNALDNQVATAGRTSGADVVKRVIQEAMDKRSEEIGNPALPGPPRSKNSDSLNTINYGQNFANYGQNFANYSQNFANYGQNFANYAQSFLEGKIPAESGATTASSPPASTLLPNGTPVPSSIESVLQRLAERQGDRED